MNEHDEQCTVVKYLESIGCICYAIPNAGKRSPSAAAWYRAEGMRKGVPDLCVPMARGGYHSLYIEMKRSDGTANDVSDEQFEEMVERAIDSIPDRFLDELENIVFFAEYEPDESQLY